MIATAKRKYRSREDFRRWNIKNTPMLFFTLVDNGAVVLRAGDGNFERELQKLLGYIHKKGLVDERELMKLIKEAERW